MVYFVHIAVSIQSMCPERVVPLSLVSIGGNR